MKNRVLTALSAVTLLLTVGCTPEVNDQIGAAVGGLLDAGGALAGSLLPILVGVVG